MVHDLDDCQILRNIVLNLDTNLDYVAWNALSYDIGLDSVNWNVWSLNTGYQVHELEKGSRFKFSRKEIIV